MSVNDEDYDLTWPRLIQFDSLTDAAGWPKADSGKYFIFEATNLIGRAHYGHTWTNQELIVSLWPEPEGHLGNISGALTRPNTGCESEVSSISIVRRRWLENCASWDRLHQVTEWIAQQCRDGNLTTFYRLKSGGRLVEMPSHEWNVERVIPSFWLFGGHDRRVPANARRFPEQTYVFFDRIQLEKKSVLRRAGSLVGQKEVVPWQRPMLP